MGAAAPGPPAAPGPVPAQLLTVGHGALRRDGLASLLRSAGVAEVVDVRRYPASRSNPDVAREALAGWLPAAGVDYRWEPRLGGRRHLTAADRATSPDTWWQVEAFRAYAGWTRTPDFRAALAQVLAGSAEARVAVMCSEGVWWRCHRRLIADVAALAHGTAVVHLMPDGALRPHQVATGARLLAPGQVVWDGATAGVQSR